MSGPAVVRGFVVCRLKPCRQRLKASASPPWPEQKLVPNLDNDGDGPCERIVIHPDRPNTWFEIVHVPSARVVLRTAGQRSPTVLRGLCGPGERLVLAQRRRGKGVRTPMRWWL